MQQRRPLANRAATIIAQKPIGGRPITYRHSPLRILLLHGHATQYTNITAVLQMNLGLRVWRTGNGTWAYQRSCSKSSPVSTGMVDRLRANIPPPYVTSRPGQLSLLPSAGREMITGQSAVLLCAICGLEVMAGWRIPFVDKRVGDM